MPFRKWKVEPVFLSRKPLPPDKPIFETTTNGTLVKCLEQMASLLILADRIFDEIGAECRLVCEKTERLKVKLQQCEEAALRLDAKAVQVPVSDLETTVQLLRRPQYVTHYDQPTQLFLPSTRPLSVDELYGKASATPVPLINAIDRYRDDGRKGSQLFMVTPVLGDVERRKKHRKMLDIETRRPASFALAKDWQEDDDNGTLVPGLCDTSISVQQRIRESGLERLPSPEELTLAASLEYPSSVIPVDTTGSSFLRMIKSRRSLIHVDFIIRRKKSKKKTKRRHTVCEGSSSKDLEDALRNISMTDTSCQTDDMPEVGSLSSSFRRSFSRRRGRATVDNVLRETDRSNLDVQKKVGKVSTPTTDDDKDHSNNKENALSCKKPTKLSLKSRNFNPISSLSAAFSIAVKMRQSSRTGKQDDGRSSSGNWSASSSTRASVDSDQHHVITPIDCTSSVSRNSVGKDSVLSDATQADTNTRFQEVISASPKHLLFSKSSKMNPSEEKKDNELWALEIDQGRQSSTSTPERTSDSTNTSVALSPYLMRKGAAPDDGESSVYSVDTDGYYTSMHTDSGLWNAVAQTFKLGDAIISESFKFRRRRESQSSVSTVGNSSINSFLSKTATEMSSNQSSLKRQKPAPQPPPRSSSAPQATQESIPPQQGAATKEGEGERSCSPMPFPNGSTSESDHEVRDRIQVKTKINSSRYPSMCAVSPETSDDEALDSVAFREKAKSPVVNVVVAEVHREENSSDSQNVQAPSPGNSDSSQEMLESFNTADTLLCGSLSPKITKPNSKSCSINMYGNHSPVLSSFSSSLVTNDFSQSSINTKLPVSTFFPDASEVYQTESNDNFKNVSPCALDQGDRNLPTDTPTLHPDIPESPNHSTVPFKYTPRITVTPIARVKVKSPTDTASETKLRMSRPDAYKSNSMAGSSTFPSFDRSLSYRSNSGNQISNPLTANSTHLQRNSSFPSVQTMRPVARVTLDPMGKVVYSSHSLDRRMNDDSQSLKFSAGCDSKPVYATLPMYQGHSASSAPEKCRHDNNQPSARVNSMEQDQIEGNELRNSESARYSSNIPNHLDGQEDSITKCQKEKSEDSAGFRQYPEAFSSARNKDFYFRPSRGGRFCRTYFPPHLISSPVPSKEPQTVHQGGSLKSFKNEPEPFQNCAHLRSNIQSNNTIMCATANRANMFSPASQYLNRTNHNDGLPQNMNNVPSHLPESSAKKLHPNSYAPVFSRLRYSQPEYASRLKSVSETHFRPLNPASPGLQHPSSSNNYQPGTYSSFDALNARTKINSSRYPTTMQSSAEENRSTFLSSFHKNPHISSNREKLGVPYMDEDDCSSQNSSLSFESGDTPQETSKLSLMSPQPPDVIPSSASPRSTLDITSPSKFSVQENKMSEGKCGDKGFSSYTPKTSTPLKSLSANELFAIIHSSKKKHNIKTESEKSLSPLSSRSSSPGIIQTPTKGIHVETGVLGRRNGSHLKPGDRHSWSGNQFSMLEKKSLAQDRLGKSKPTSMHDFKMLLLQARSGSSDLSPRPSAAELLKVSPPQSLNSSGSVSPSRSLTSSPIRSLSHTKPQSPVVPYGSLPLKRTVRTRSPYLTRYDSAYPPIMEDCSEESESVTDSYPSNSHVISSAQSYSQSNDGCDRYQRDREGNRPNSKATSTWV